MSAPDLRAARIGEMVTPGARQHRLNGLCPDGSACTLPVHCSQLCSRLESAEIAAELRVNVVPMTGHSKGEEPPMEPEPAEPAPFGECKIDGCDEPAAAARGQYAKLCPAHRAEAADRRAQPKPRAAESSVPPPTARNGSRPDQLTQLAQQLGDAIADTTRLTGELEHARTRVRKLAAEVANT